MELSMEQRCLLWLSSAEIPASRAASLIAAFGSAQTLWERYQTSDCPRIVPKSKQVLDDLYSDQKMSALIRQLDEKHVRLLFADDPSYPPLLREIKDPPYLLYYAGHLDCLKKPCVAIVGTRTPSDYGRHMAKSLAAGLCNAGVTVVSGLAKGIDYAAHTGALSVQGCTAGILGSGINHPYPSEHTPLLRQIAHSKGVVISEYPLDAAPMPFHFPHRNRIISGCCVGIIFVEGRIKSGGMHTVTAALDQGREVFAVPGQTGYIGAEGPLAIIREGARLVTSAEDILEDLALSPLMPAKAPPKQHPDLSDLQQRIIHALQIQPANIDELSVSLSVSPQDIMTEISIMEITGLIHREAGNNFSLSHQ
ncbi:MAG: DNA-protecting protein DprA [Clostridiales bacterium]|nr:DNA-protecting protein DprA [Clostridiales bacterium]